MDGRPLNISTTELNAFLEGCLRMLSKRLKFTQPGAEFPATLVVPFWILLLIKMLRITWARLTLIVPVLQAIMVYGGEWTTAVLKQVFWMAIKLWSEL
jgi:hypothetical protein